MNKADEKQLKKDPRYQQIQRAHKALRVILDGLDKQREEAIADFEAATGLLRLTLSVERSGDLDERALFSLLRPKGDKCRYTSEVLTSNPTWTEYEVENVTEQRVVFVGGIECYRSTGARRHSYLRGRLHPDDLAKIQASELKGWRQKPWGQS